MIMGPAVDKFDMFDVNKYSQVEAASRKKSVQELIENKSGTSLYWLEITDIYTRQSNTGDTCSCNLVFFLLWQTSLQGLLSNLATMK